MSADNYYSVRRVADKWYATMGFASDEGEVYPDVDKDQSFNSFEEAYDFADSDWTEYGVQWAKDIDTEEECRRWRRIQPALWELKDYARGYGPLENVETILMSLRGEEQA